MESTEWLLLHCFQVELEFGNVGFFGGRKTGVPGEKPYSTLTNAPSLFPFGAGMGESRSIFLISTASFSLI